jgi:hypothetical protein
VVQKLDLLVEHGIAVIIVLARRGRTMSENPFSLWVYLFPQSPLLWLTVTLLVPVAVTLMVRRFLLRCSFVLPAWRSAEISSIAFSSESCPGLHPGWIPGSQEPVSSCK